MISRVCHISKFSFWTLSKQNQPLKSISLTILKYFLCFKPAFDKRIPYLSKYRTWNKEYTWISRTLRKVQGNVQETFIIHHVDESSWKPKELITLLELPKLSLNWREAGSGLYFGNFFPSITSIHQCLKFHSGIPSMMKDKVKLHVREPQFHDNINPKLQKP